MIEWVIEHLAVVMFVFLVIGLFLGYPVALTLVGFGVLFGFI
jgi:TRAP-type mannitol/chloroaromatic compound transport system permease large subunit